MNKLTLIFLMFLYLSVNVYAQVPEQIKYQAVIRDNTGEILSNQSVGIKISILKNSGSGSSVYIERHIDTTSLYGLIDLNIGAGNVIAGGFSTIDWGNDQYFVKIEVDLQGGTTYTHLGTFQLLSVPYALYAKDVANKDDADPNPENEIQTISLSGDTLQISKGNEIVFPYDSSYWSTDGNTMYYNNGNVGIGSSTPNSQLEVKSSSTSNALFQVINANNDTVFAVYPDGVKVFVDPTAKGRIGGFAVSGRTNTKADNIDYLSVTPDSTRIYVNEDTTKGRIGGFAVSGRTNTKGTVNDYMVVTGDSTRIYLNDNPSAKGRIGGFAVSGRTNVKGLKKDYFNIFADSVAEIINPSEPRILWYPNKEAFLSGRVLIESPDSVGTNSMATGFESKAIGNYAQALGYKSVARGDYSTAIGKRAVASQKGSFAFGNEAIAKGENAFSFGQWAKADSSESYAFGKGAIANGFRSFALGSAGIDSAGAETGVAHASGAYSMALGQGSVSSGKGSFSIGLGNNASGYYSTAIGYKTTASEMYTTAIGYKTTASTLWSTAIGVSTVASGRYSVAIGHSAKALYYNAIALGLNTKAIGYSAMALGYGTEASGSGSTAMGKDTEASGKYSTAMGIDTRASGENSTAFGSFSRALGISSTAFGISSIANGWYSIAMGEGTLANGCNLTVLGRYNIVSSAVDSVLNGDDPIFTVGNGENYSNRSNAMTILQNGQVYFPDVYEDDVGTTYRDLYIGQTGKIGYLTSSRKYKRNIRAIKNIEWLYQLNPVSFIYKKDRNEQKQFGLIAEEVAKVNSLLVSYDGQNEPETVQYSQLITPILKALQEQQELNKKQKEEIEELKNSVAELKELINGQ